MLSVSSSSEALSSDACSVVPSIMEVSCAAASSVGVFVSPNALSSASASCRVSSVCRVSSCANAVIPVSVKSIAAVKSAHNAFLTSFFNCFSFMYILLYICSLLVHLMNPVCRMDNSDINILINVSADVFLVAEQLRVVSLYNRLKFLIRAHSDNHMADSRP